MRLMILEICTFTTDYQKPCNKTNYTRNLPFQTYNQTLTKETNDKNLTMRLIPEIYK